MDVPRPDGTFIDSSEPGGQQTAGEETAESKVEGPPKSAAGGEPIKANLTEGEKKRIRENTVLNVTLKPEHTMVSEISHVDFMLEIPKEY